MAKQFRIKREWYSKHFIGYLESDKRYNFLMGGRGSSKSHHVFLKHFAETFQSRYTNIYYCRNDETTIRETTFKDMCLFLEMTGLDIFFDYSKVQNSAMIFRNKLTGWTITPFGLRNVDKIKGIAQPSHIFIDELDACSPESFGAVNAVLRTPKAQGYMQFTGMWNPVSMESWVRKFFFEEDDAYQIKRNIVLGDTTINLSEQSYFNRSTLLNNEYIDHESYKQTLIINAMGRQDVLECELFGRWGITQVKSPAFQNFDVKKHVTTLEINPNHPLIFGVDFNGEPLAVTIWQIYFEQGQHYIHCVRELKFENNAKTVQLIDYIKKTFPNHLHTMKMRGDATGRAETTANLANWTQIENAFNLRQRLEVPNTNPHVLSSVELFNYILYWHPNFKIDKSCQNLIFELQYTEKDEKGLVKKDRTKAEQKADFVDTARYVINWDFAIVDDLIARPSRYGINIK